MTGRDISLLKTLAKQGMAPPVEVPLFGFAVEKIRTEGFDEELQFILTEEVFDELLSYDWPGNVRELEMMIRRICELYGGRRVGVEELRDMGFWSEEGSRPELPSQFKLKEEVERFKRKLIMMALRETNGNISKAAEMLGISRVGLKKMMERLKIRCTPGDER
jgi:transcriptional regulator with PAS, ATPase and Fis domain